MPFNWFDLLLILLLLVGAAVGYMQGIIRQIIGLAALYIALVLATQFFQPVAGGFSQFTKMPSNVLTNAVTFFVIFFVIVLIINFIAKDAYRSTRLQLVPWTDHIGGMILGLASMWALLTIAVSVLAFTTSTDTWIQAESVRLILRSGLESSRLAEYSEETLPVIINSIRPWLPTGLPALFEI